MAPPFPDPAPATDDIDAGFGLPAPFDGSGPKGPERGDADAGFGVLDDGGFGMLDLSLPDPGAATDLSLPHDGDADLPMPQVTDADLPMAAAELPVVVPPKRPAFPKPAAPPPTKGGARPAPPAAAPRQPAPSPGPSPEARQPSPARPPERRQASTQPSKYSDLPLPKIGDDDLPMPAIGLPMRAERADLPVPLYDNLPVPADHNLPQLAAGLPVPADLDLPLPSPTGDLPLPADFNFPTRIGTSADGDIPMADSAHGLGLPATHPGHTDADFLRAGRFSSEPPAAGDSLPPELRNAGLASLPPHLRGVALASLPPHLRDDALASTPHSGQRGSVGGEFDVDQVVGPDDATVQLDDLEDEDAPRVRIKKKKTRSLKIAVVAGPIVLLLMGAVPFLMGGGVFAKDWIGDFLNAGEHEAILQSFRHEAALQLEDDTASQTRTVLSQALQRQKEMPRFVPMTGYAAYLAFYNSVRFGSDPEQLAMGKQLLDGLVSTGATGPLAALAMAAGSAADKRFDEARAQIAEVLNELGNDADALVIAGYIELGERKAQAAMAHFQAAAQVSRSARAVFGMAQSALYLKQPDKALELAREALKLSKSHAGARTLAARLLWEKNVKDEEAAKLLDQVLAPGDVRSAASKDELVEAYALYGTILMDQKQLGAAEKAFQEALKLEPQSRLALVGSGELFYQSGRNSEAQARFEAAFRADGKNLMAGVGLAKTMLALENTKQALAQLDALNKEHKHPEAGYWLGKAYEANGERAQAEKAYRSAIATGDLAAPALVRSYVELASLYAAQGKQREADDVLAEASKKLPDSANLHVAKGEVALKAGRLGDAKAEFTRALELEPKDLQARFELAVTLRKLRDFAAAKIAFDDIAKVDPDYTGLTLERGVLFADMGELDKALAMYNDALKKAPEDIDLKLRVGSTQVVSGQAEQAVKLLREVLEKRPRSAEVNHFLGRALLLRGEAPEGLRWLQFAVQYDPNRAEYWLYVAWAANEVKQTSLAEEAIEKTFALDQSLGDAYWQRAVSLQVRGKDLDALKDLAIALEKNPSRAEAYATMALCYTGQTNPAKAEESLRKALELKSDVADWHYRLGKLLADRGAHADAAEHLDKTVTLLKGAKVEPGWTWHAYLLLGESIRPTNPKRALEAYREFVRRTASENAYRAEAEQAIQELEAQVGSN